MTTKVRGRPWSEIKAEYASSTITFKKIAEKYDIPIETIKSRAKKDRWSTARKKYQENVNEKTLRKLASKTSSERVKKLLQLQHSADHLADLIEKVTKDTDHIYLHLVQTREKSGDIKTGIDEKWDVEQKEFEKPDTKSILELSAALKNVSQVVRDVYDIPTAKEQSAMDIAVERLKIDQKKADQDDNGTNEVTVGFESKDVEEMAK